MKRIKKRYIFIIFLFICLLAVSSIYVFEDFFIKIATIRLMENLSGARVTIEQLNFDTEKNAIHIKDFRMYNPKGFPEGILIEMPRLTLVGVRVDFENGKIPIDFADIEISNMTVIKNEERKFNIDELRFVKEGREKGIELFDVIPIKEFEFSMEKVLYKDYSKLGEEPYFRVYEVRIKDRKYSHMIGIGDLLIMIFHEALGETTIKGAAVVGLVALGGPGFLPLGAAIIVLGRDSATAEFQENPENAFLKSVKTIDKLGKRTKTRKVENHRIIKAVIEDHNVIVKICENGGDDCKITVYARKYLVPMPHFASTVLYYISENIQ